VPDNDFSKAYATALSDYLRTPGEDGLYTGYGLGRRAVEEQFTLLDFLTVHHQALETLFEGDSTPKPDVLALAARFVTESLASFEMIQRGADEAVRAVAYETRQAEVLRSLSALLADASLADGGGASLPEMLTLVAEQARELSETDRCTIVIDGHPPLVASDPPTDQQTTGSADQVRIGLTTLGGKAIGVMTVEPGTDFRSRDLEMLEQVGRMLAAAIERHRAYPP
jgi:hypothetical protein